MNRKLLVLNVVLAAIVVFAGVQFRNEWKAAKARERATFSRKVTAPAPPPFTPLPAAPPVLSAGYKDIAEKMLFHPSRNSTVVVDVPPPEPPKPMPALPRYHGQMNIDGITAILSEGPNTPHQPVKPGEAIGQFKLLDVNTEEITLEWDGRVVHKTLGELTDRNAVQADARPAASAQPAPAVQQIVQTPTGPGADTGRGFKTCNLNDSTPEGAVVDGFRKVISQTPFGPACRWDPVGR